MQKLTVSSMHKSASSESLNRMSRVPSVESCPPRVSSADSLKSMAKSASDGMLKKIEKSASVESLTKIAMTQTTSAAVLNVSNDTCGIVVAAVFGYLIGNNRIAMKMPSLLLHPKKLSKAASVQLAGFVVNSNFLGDKIEHISDIKLHLAAEIVLKALKLALIVV
ncbi:hypothetical protein PBCVNEJV1_789L [Paramecium bursaria Chlorella virus NE-JV-1]|nr:hypothetical protein PBCVNEJV1_789L [Paramecium bursaria Chlorella virus NE-JV-1]